MPGTHRAGRTAALARRPLIEVDSQQREAIDLGEAVGQDDPSGVGEQRRGADRAGPSPGGVLDGCDEIVRAGHLVMVDEDEVRDGVVSGPGTHPPGTRAASRGLRTAD